MSKKPNVDKLSMERNALNQKLVQTGERDRIKEYVQTTLNDCGWREDLKKHCIEFIKQKGIEKVTIQEITSEIAPRARATVPDNLKTELFNRLRSFSEQHPMESAGHPSEKIG
mmetsp:Transcript_118784/g.222062  ORF Transcript_118784/g.222062 Transcript_118784/m.222062 type:complete len:113 (+) Transcript_118784:117-455(+)